MGRFGRVVTVAVTIGTTVVVAACGASSSGSSDGSASTGGSSGSRQSPTVIPKNSCGQPAPEASAWCPPKSYVQFHTVSMSYHASFSDGTTADATGTKPFSTSLASSKVEVQPDETEIDLYVGDVAAGLVVSMTDRSSTKDDDLPAAPGPVPGAFVALQYRNHYWPDGNIGVAHRCAATLTSFTHDKVAGSITCNAKLPSSGEGPFTGSSKAASPLSVMSAKGTFEAHA